MKTKKRTEKLKIVGIGELLWDIFGEEKALGGAPTNFACHCASFGATASIISAVGNDELGEQSLSFLTNYGVNIENIAIDKAVETGAVNVLLDEKGVPTYDIKENVAWDFIPLSEKALSLAKDVDAVCFGSLSQRNIVSRNSIQCFLENTSADCLKMFDINIRQHYHSNEVILKSLKLANALKLNDEELPMLANILNIKGSDKELLKVIQEKFELKLAILTCGAEGALMLSDTEESFEIPPVPTEIKSTVGAGDSFTAAAVMGFLQNNALAEINKHANAVASYVCSQTGAVPKLPVHLSHFE